MAVVDARTRSAHPLGPVTAEEIDTVREALVDAGLLEESVRYCYASLEEPDKATVLSHAAGDPVDRRFRVLLLDLATGRGRDVVVSATRRQVDVVLEVNSATDGQMPIIDAEFDLVEEIVNQSPEWLAAMERRGLDPGAVRTVPLSAGAYDPVDAGRRMCRVLGFRQDHPKDSPWAHPVDGVVAYVDLTARAVTTVIDERVFPVPAEPGNFDDPEQVGPERTTLRPIRITQPEGVSFSIDDSNLLSWEGWNLRIGFNEREGVTLHEVSIHGRPVVYRASIAEMVVPYADPSGVRYWQNYFDCGEYMFARYSSALELGCDCLGDITYLNPVITDDFGRPKTLPNAVCLHEEDFGILWKHWDLFTESRQTRRQRRMVISFFTTVGNYDYGFYWYLYLDGTMGCEAKLTGIPFTSAYPAEGSPYASEVAPGLGAPYHQHLFSARLDMMVDGVRNAVEEVDIVPVPMGPENPYGNAFTESRNRLASEATAARRADPARSRTWQVINPERLNRFGKPVGYALRPEGTSMLLADPRSVIASRAAFATKDLWVTAYDPTEMHPAGQLVNQHPGDAGLPTWVAQDRNLDGQDVVLWHTFGLSHVPRPEDWPIMNVDTAGFKLTPVGFFDRNPALDVAPTSGPPCH
jgi:primary-amine oxidase